MATVEFKTFMIQSATPALAVLPILANQGKGDVEFSTNVVTLSTVLFIVVIPILQNFVRIRRKRDRIESFALRNCTILNTSIPIS